MFSRLIGVAAATKSKRRWDPTQEPEELNILKNFAQFYTFYTYPWTLWLLGLGVLGISLFLHYFLWWVANKEERSYLAIFFLIVLYYTTFFIFYAGKVEKKGIIKHETTNMFLSKKEKVYKTEDILDMEILHKGKIRRDGDYTRYFIRIIFKEKESLIFGECLTLRKAADKFRKCLALLKGIVMPDVVDSSMVTDESIDERTALFEN